MFVIAVQLTRMLGVYFVVSGMVFAAYPASLRQYIAFWSKGRRLYAVGVMRFVSAMAILLAVPAARWPRVLAVLGAFNLLLSIPYFIKGVSGMRSMAAAWQRRPFKQVRVLGTVSVAIGVLVLLST